MKKIPPIVAIFLTILFDTISFGLVIPDLQTRVNGLIPPGLPLWVGGLVIGFCLSIFSLAQFLVAPFLGALSDTRGRKSVLIFTCALSAASAFMYIFANSIPIIVISRLLGGLAAANLGVAQAYVTDISTGEARAKSMGVLGMAFGVGFMIGPPLGVLLLHLGHGTPTYIGVAATFFALINLVFVATTLKNQRAVAENGDGVKRSRWMLLTRAFRTGSLAKLLVAFFCFNFAFSHLESTYYLVGAQVYRVTEGQVTTVLIAVGLTSFLTQGLLLRALLPRLKEVVLLRLGYLTVCPAMFAIPYIQFGVLAYVGAAAFGLGNGVSQPSLNSLISREAPAEIVGEIFGVTASLSALARIIAPSWANVLFRADPRYTYASATLFLVVALATALMYKPSVVPADPIATSEGMAS